MSTSSGQRAPAWLVHGMGTTPAEPDWAPLTDEEATAVLSRYQVPAAGRGVSSAAASGAGGRRAGPRALVTWRSPRPMSAAALVRAGGGTVFVKRHHTRVRTGGQLAAEHAFAGHLRARGVPVPEVLRSGDGASAVRLGDFVYEVHAEAHGTDLYRDALSWSPFTGPGHARAAGAALARLHRAAAGFPLRPRPPAVLTTSCEIITARDPLAAVGALAARRPGLARYLVTRRWRDDLARHVLPAIGRAAPLLAPLARQWGHGDWHPSNLTWTSTGPGAQVAGVIDLGLANRTIAVHDLATAIERTAVSWLDLPASGRAGTDLAALDALLDGYEAVRPLTAAEAAALPAVLPVVHVDYALSEIEYFADVVHSPANAGLAYDTYLIGHARWFGEPEGLALLSQLRQRVARRR